VEIEVNLRAEPTRSTSVVTYFYESADAARDAAEAIQRAHRQSNVVLTGILGAAVVGSSEPAGNLRLEPAVELGDASSVDFAAIFPPAILNLRAVGIDAGKASEHFEALGFGVNLLREIGENLPAGGAALVLVIAEPWIEELSEVVGGHKGVERYPVAPGASLGNASKRSSQ
jgi:uncharacterized membrane protein